jgi:nitroreductase
MNEISIKHPVIEDLKWRYATKKFDATKKVSDRDLEIVKEALQLVPSSYGLQPLKFLFIENPDLRERLKEKSWNQSQVTDASHLLVICSLDTMNSELIDEHMELHASIRGLALESTTGYANFVKKVVDNMEPEFIRMWNGKQAYIALGHLLQTLAQLRIDATPMEGFDKLAVEELLDAKQRGLQVELLVPFGYRSDLDVVQHAQKVRKPLEKLFETI